MNAEMEQMNAIVDANENAFLSPCCEAPQPDNICSSCKRNAFEMLSYQYAVVQHTYKKAIAEQEAYIKELKDVDLRTIDAERSRTPLASDQESVETPLSSDGNSVLRDVRPDGKPIVRTQI